MPLAMIVSTLVAIIIALFLIGMSAVWHIDEQDKTIEYLRKELSAYEGERR